MYKPNRKYAISEALLENLITLLSDDKLIVHRKGENRKLKFFRIDVQDSHTSQIKENLPAIYVMFKLRGNSPYMTGCIIQKVLTYYAGFTSEQEQLIQQIANICNEQDQAFVEEDKIMAAKQHEKEAAILAETEAAQKNKIANMSADVLAEIRIVATDEDGHTLSKDQWLNLYDAVKDGFPRSKYESRAVIYNGTLYCNAARALIDYEMDPKSGNKFYEACERGHKYAGHSCIYASPEQILAYINQAFGE